MDVINKHNKTQQVFDYDSRWIGVFLFILLAIYILRLGREMNENSRVACDHSQPDELDANIPESIVLMNRDDEQWYRYYPGKITWGNNNRKNELYNVRFPLFPWLYKLGIHGYNNDMRTSMTTEYTYRAVIMLVITWLLVLNITNAWL